MVLPIKGDSVKKNSFLFKKIIGKERKKKVNKMSEVVQSLPQKSFQGSQPQPQPRPISQIDTNAFFDSLKLEFEKIRLCQIFFQQEWKSRTALRTNERLVQFEKDLEAIFKCLEDRNLILISYIMERYPLKNFFSIFRVPNRPSTTLKIEEEETNNVPTKFSQQCRATFPAMKRMVDIEMLRKIQGAMYDQWQALLRVLSWEHFRVNFPTIAAEIENVYGSVTPHVLK